MCDLYEYNKIDSSFEEKKTEGDEKHLIKYK